MFVSAGDSNNITTSTAAAAEVPMDMVPNRQYRLTARGADLWFAVTVPSGSGVTVAGAPTAAAVAGSGSHFLANGRTFDVAAIGVFRTRVSIIRDAAANVTGVLSEIPTVRT